MITQNVVPLWRCIGSVFLGLVLAAQASAATSATPSSNTQCVDAAYNAAAETQVPFDVLMAISLTETDKPGDRAATIWPWTVNMEGKGHWFPDKLAATEFAITEYDRGARSFDVGCFQINYRWHGHHFRTIEEMFDPLTNARYAAQFLAALYAETGSWPAAAGAYHSRTKTYADRYRAKFERHLAALDHTDAPEQGRAFRPVQLAQSNRSPAAQVSRQNSFPLLQRNQSTSRLGSLVPVSGLAGTGHLFLRDR